MSSRVDGRNTLCNAFSWYTVIRSEKQYLENNLRLTQALFTLYRMSFAPVRKPYQKGPLFIHKDGDFGAICLTERNCASPVSKVESHISDRCSSYTGYLFVSYSSYYEHSLNLKR